MMQMDPKLRATFEVGASAFAMGALAYLEPVLNGGNLPPSAQWGHVLLMAAVAGAIMTYHRLFPSPTAQSSVQETSTLVTIEKEQPK